MSVCSIGLPLGLFEYFVCETDQSLSLLLVSLQILVQQVTECDQCLLLEHQLVRFQQTLSDGRLKLPERTQLKLMKENKKSLLKK